MMDEPGGWMESIELVRSALDLTWRWVCHRARNDT